MILSGVYAFDFTVNNLSKEAADYAFRASINTMAVETVDGEDYMSDSAYGLMPEVTFTTDAAVRYVYDLNGDGEADIKDAEALPTKPIPNPCPKRIQSSMTLTATEKSPRRMSKSTCAASREKRTWWTS